MTATVALFLTQALLSVAALILLYRRNCKLRARVLQLTKFHETVKADNVVTDPWCPRNRVYIMNPEDAARLKVKP